MNDLRDHQWEVAVLLRGRKPTPS